MSIEQENPFNNGEPMLPNVVPKSAKQGTFIDAEGKAIPVEKENQLTEEELNKLYEKDEDWWKN